jgi:hypothetical protein
MIEIAIALGVIGFALVAIVGVLPMGLNTQKDNREETIINHDSAYFMEAIRSGAKNLDELTNFVDAVVVHLDANINTYTGPYTCSNIIGLLSYPTFVVNGGVTVTNKIEAFVRALSGSALEVSQKQKSSAQKEMAFKYRLTPEILPYWNFSPDYTNFQAYPVNTVERNVRETRFNRAWTLPNNLFEVRLRFEWPLLPNGSVPNTHHTVVRTFQVSGTLQTNQTGDRYFFTQQQYN